MLKFLRVKNVLLISGLLIIASVLLASCSSSSPVSVEPTAVPTALGGDTGSSAGTSDANTGSNTGEVSYKNDIQPILDNLCVNCHGGEKTARGLNLKSYEGVMAGSSRGPVVFAGDAGGSKLVLSVQMGSMPKRGTKLTADQIQLLVNWINAGAPNN